MNNVLLLQLVLEAGRGHPIIGWQCLYQRQYHFDVAKAKGTRTRECTTDGPRAGSSSPLPCESFAGRSLLLAACGFVQAPGDLKVPQSIKNQTPNRLYNNLFKVT